MTPPLDNLILFDGTCGLCTSSVRFIIRHDKSAVFKFAPIQSERGSEIYRALGLDPHNLQTFLVLKNGCPFVRSDAVFEVVRQFGGLWRLLFVFKLVPSGLRDWLYAVIAENRHRWFGRRDACMNATEDIKRRFLA